MTAKDQVKLNIGGEEITFESYFLFFILKLQLHVSFGHMNIHVKH